MAGISAGRVAAAGFGVAGYDFPSDRDGHLDAIRSLGLNCPVEVVNDGFNGLLAGATRGIGVNVTSGSSNNCRGRNKEGRIGRIVGNGSTFGEYGGGIEIARRALQMVSYSWTRRNPPTRLTKVLLDATGATDELDLMEGGWCYLNEAQRALLKGCGTAQTWSVVYIAPAMGSNSQNPA